MKKTLFFLLLSLFLVTLCFAREEDDMNLVQISNITQICAGGLIAAESSLLLFGMNYPTVSDWSTVKNISFAVSDIILGSSLVYYSVTDKNISPSLIVLTYSILLSTHILRSFEIIPVLSENRFCHNIPLYVLNNIRIGLLATGIGFTYKINY